MVRFRGKSECFGYSIDPEVCEIGIERFESAYYLLFMKRGGDGKLRGKNAVWQMIVFSRLNKVNFYLFQRLSKRDKLVPMTGSRLGSKQYTHHATPITPIFW